MIISGRYQTVLMRDKWGKRSSLILKRKHGQKHGVFCVGRRRLSWQQREDPLFRVRMIYSWGQSQLESSIVWITQEFGHSHLGPFMIGVIYSGNYSWSPTFGTICGWAHPWWRPLQLGSLMVGSIYDWERTEGRWRGQTLIRDEEMGTLKVLREQSFSALAEIRVCPHPVRLCS